MDSRLAIVKIKAGDEDVFSDIIDAYSGYLAKVINNVYALNVFDTEDVIAETMLSLWKSSKRLKEDSNLKSYLATIARNKTIDFVRKRRMDVIQLDEQHPDNLDIEGDYLRNELTSFLRAKIDELKEPDKSILVYRYYRGWKSKEIADKLQLNQNIVDIKLSRGRAMLRKKLLEMVTY